MLKPDTIGKKLFRFCFIAETIFQICPLCLHSWIVVAAFRVSGCTNEGAGLLDPLPWLSPAVSLWILFFLPGNTHFSCILVVRVSAFHSCTVSELVYPARHYIKNSLFISTFTLPSLVWRWSALIYHSYFYHLGQTSQHLLIFFFVCLLCQRSNQDT